MGLVRAPLLVVNAVTHVATALVHGAYNPGVLTSLVLFAPMGAWMLRTVVRSGVVSRRQQPVTHP